MKPKQDSFHDSLIFQNHLIIFNQLSLNRFKLIFNNVFYQEPINNIM